MIEVRLPSAPPSAYLRWVDWWTGVDRTTADNQVLQAILKALMHGGADTEQSSQALDGKEFCRRILAQALTARRQPRELLEPIISCHPDELRRLGQGMEAASRFVDWWSRDMAAGEIIRLPRASWRTEHLHAGILQVLRRQAELLAERTDEGAVIDLVHAAAGTSRGPGPRAPEDGGS